MTTRKDINPLRESIGEWAKELDPQDRFTTFGYGLSTVLGGILGWPSMLIVPISTLILGALSLVSFGLILIPFLVVLWVLNIVTVGTSWLWINVPASRVFVLIPGVVSAAIQENYTAMLPYHGDWAARADDLARPESWPRSLHVQHLPRYRADALALWGELKDSYTRGEISATELIRDAREVWGMLDLTTVDLGDQIQQEYHDLTSDQADADA